MRLSAFAGALALERDHRGRARRPHRPADRRGAVRRPAPDGLAYVEEGTLAFPGAAPMRASRRYLWRDGGAGTIDVWFEDGRFFHRFDAEDPAPAAAHDCPPDLYRVRYDFRALAALAGGMAGAPARARTTASSRRFRPAGSAGMRRLRSRCSLLAACGAAGAAGAGAGPRRALPADARLPRRGDAGAALHAGRPGARLRRHQGRRPGQARRLADRAGHRGHRHRGPAGAAPAGGRASGATAGRSARAAAPAAAERIGLAINSKGGPHRRTCCTSTSPASSRPCASARRRRRSARTGRPSPSSRSPATPTTSAGSPRSSRARSCCSRELPGARADMADQSLAVIGAPAAASTCVDRLDRAGRGRRGGGSCSTRTAG